MPSNMGACDPIKPPSGGGGYIQPVRTRIYDLTQLSPEDYRAVGVTMHATLGAAATTGQDSFRVPTTHELVILEIRGHLALIDLDNEVLNQANPSDATKGLGNHTSNPDIVGRIAGKAMNVKVNLKNSDREQKIFDGKPIGLADILTTIGGKALDYELTPHIVPAGETLLLELSLVQTAAPWVSGNMECGIVLTGVLVRTARS